MKQTNNAIKFLMAQYRAIFKNANIAMVAAIAAAALAAGQAQAAPSKDAAALDNNALTEELKNSADGVIIVADGTGTQKDGTFKNFTISGAAADAGTDLGNKAFTIKLTSGAHTIEGVATGGKLTAKSGSIILDGNKDVTDIANNKLTVGGTTDVTANLAAVEVKKGTLVVSKADATANTVLNAATITLGNAEATADDVIAKASVLKSGSLGGESTTSVRVLKGGELSLGNAAAKVVASEGVELSGGKLSLEAAATDAVISSKLSVKSGSTVTLADASGLTVEKGLTVDGGKVVVGSAGAATLTVKGDASFSGKDALKVAAAAGKLSVSNGNVTFGEGSIATDNAGIVEVKDIAANATKTITVQQGDWANLIKGKLNVTGASADTSVLQVNVEGTAAQKELDLAGFTDATAGTFAAFGSNNPKVTANKAKIKFVADHVKFTNGTKYAAGAGIIEAGTLTVGEQGVFSIDDGVVTVKNALNVTAKTDTQKLTVSGAGVLNLDAATGTSGSVSAKDLVVSGTAADTKSLNIKGTWKTTGGLDIQKGTVTVENGNLTIGGKLNIAATNGKLVGDASVIDATSEGAFAFGGASNVELNNTSTLKLSADKVFTIANDANKTLTVTTNAFAAGAVVANSNSKLSLKTADGKKVSLTEAQYDALLSGTKFNGLFENVVISDLKVKKEMQLSEIKSGQAGLYDKTVVDASNKDIASGSYDVGSVKVSDGSLSLESGASLSLVNASVNGGNFVSGKDASGNVVVGKVVLSDEKGNGLTLGGSGKIGSITVADTKGAGNSTVTFGEAGNSGKVTVTGSVGEDTKELGNVIVNGSNVTVNSGDVYTHNVDINDGSLTLGKDQSLFIGSANGDLTSSIDGDVTATNLTLKGKGGSLNIAGNATVSVNNLVGASGVSINVGKDAIKSGSATLVAGSMSLAGGGLFIDPDYDQTKASAVVMNLSGNNTDKNAGTLDGKVAIGANAAFGVGFSSLAEMDALISDYLTGGHFTEDTTNGGVHNALVLNKRITVANNMGIMVGENAAISSVSGNQIDIAAGSALVITDNVFDVAADGSKTGAAINFAGTNAKANVSGSELLLVGEFTAKDDALTIFSGTSAAVTGNMTIKSLNGLLVGTMSNGQVNLDLTQDETLLAKAFVDSSAPIRELLLDSKRGDLGDGKGLGRDLVNKISSVSLSGAVVDAAAHAATYAGAQQAAVASVTTMADAMFGRVGAVGVEAASISATGSQTKGGVWLTPMYKSVDADGFNAEGASYGADVDLAGVAFGTDTVNGNMRFGAVFNIGSGDADGKGNGNGLKDEFDYYGFGIYSAMGFGNLALIGDASMTVISHEVEGLGLKGEADTTAVTMGLTGQYTVATPAVDVTPHLGARFIRLNTDSYDLVGEKGVVANTEFDVQNVFSIPVGVTLSKAFVTGGWSLAPSADLTVAFNTGDTEAKSNTRFTGINKNIGLNTEVLDEVTYGLTVGLGAQYGAFGTSFGINYTGSENTDSFGVNAQARYMF